MFTRRRTLIIIDLTVTLSLLSLQWAIAAQLPTFPQLTGKLVRDYLVMNRGSTFKVEVITPITSMSATAGDTIKCRLLYDLVVMDRKVASKGDVIEGKISTVDKPKRSIKSYIPGKHFLNADARLGVLFNSLTANGKQIPLLACLAANTSVFKNHPAKVQLIVNRDNELECDYDTKKLWLVDGAITVASFAAGPAGLIVAPALSGVAGAVSSTYAKGRPPDKGEDESTAKNVMLGIGKGLPGGDIVDGVTTRGAHLFLEAGDQMTLMLTQDAYFQ